GPYMIALLVGTGIFLSFRLKFLQVKDFGFILKKTFGRAFEKENLGENEISSGQAGFSSIAAVVGTGNIAGVATAIAVGGPGAVFWMWFAAFFGMATKSAEIMLGVKYREKKEHGYVGGPMYYLDKGLNQKWLAVFFALMVIITYFVIGAIVDTNTMVLSIEEQYGINPLISGVVISVATAIVIFGGIKSIGEVCEKLTPIMGGIYVVAGLAVLILNITKVPGAFVLIFSSAFRPMAATGGFAGATLVQVITMGTARGLFSNEAGMGSSPMLHVSSKTDDPGEEGIWGVTEVFFDTMIICTITALTILISGEWDSGASGVALTMRAFTVALNNDIGALVVLISAVLFGYSCLITVNYYCEIAGRYLFGEKS
ncbi:MAG: amino acid carrier protein, partial [Gallicola sp.]|nr:amino acid carrier protein [Gallicola sp.]